ncbi:hypothetical protein DIPPA_31508 [Diplonema papillatum]|nr:hypothetical protein DIPPA_31508 [Diplonema papillatum]
MDVTYTLPADYGYVLLGMCGMVFQCAANGATSGRYKAMSPEFIEKNLKEENELFKKKYGYGIPKGGYPDMTDGRHASKLPYAEWLEYACKQRTHYNYVESLAGTLVTAGISGLVFPRFTACNLVMYIIGRYLYSSGYRANGPNGRLRGAFFNLNALVLLFTACITSALFTPYGKQVLGSYFL